jgi:hypothetical protein
MKVDWSLAAKGSTEVEKLPEQLNGHVQALAEGDRTMRSSRQGREEGGQQEVDIIEQMHSQANS